MQEQGRELAEEIRAAGLRLGLDAVGFAAAGEHPEGAQLKEWLARGYHAGMGWMARDPGKRADPRRLLPAARTVVAAALNYYHPARRLAAGEAPLISRYAWGEDYHAVMASKLERLAVRIRELCPGSSTRVCCDTSPVMDKAWAARAGLGWLGKNACLIDRRLGSWLFLGEILLDRDLPADAPVPDRCGTCRRCLDACPTQALVAPRLLDARRCISYLTIEHRGPFAVVPDAGETGFDQGPAIGGWLAGCDICQDVCPWNRKAPSSTEAAFLPRAGLAVRPLASWVAISKEEYAGLVRATALNRIKWADMRRNAAAVSRNRGEGERGALRRAPAAEARPDPPGGRIDSRDRPF